MSQNHPGWSLSSTMAFSMSLLMLLIVHTRSCANTLALPWGHERRLPKQQTPFLKVDITSHSSISKDSE